MFSLFKPKHTEPVTSMFVTCHSIYAPIFRSMGFADDVYPPPATIKADLCTGFATFQHIHNPPKKFPYFAYHRRFNELTGPHFMACDGTKFIKVPGDRSGFVIRWNEETNQPNQEDLANVAEYQRIKALVLAQLVEPQR